jgi:hypothetical protein
MQRHLIPALSITGAAFLVVGLLMCMGNFSPLHSTLTRIKSFEGGEEFVEDETDFFTFPSVLTNHPGYAFLELGDVIGSLKIAALDTTTFDLANRSIGLTTGIGRDQSLGTVGIFFTSTQQNQELTYLEDIPRDILEPKYRSTYPSFPKDELRFLYSQNFLSFITLGVSARTGYESSRDSDLTNFPGGSGDQTISTFSEKKLWAFSGGATIGNREKHSQLDVSFTREWLSLDDRLTLHTYNLRDTVWIDSTYTSREYYMDEPLNRFNLRFTKNVSPRWDIVISSLYEQWEFESRCDISSSPTDNIGYQGTNPVPSMEYTNDLGYDATHRRFKHRFWNTGGGLRYRPEEEIIVFTGIKAENIQSSVDLFNSSGASLEHIRVSGDISFSLIVGTEVGGIPGLGPFQETIVRFGSFKKLTRNHLAVRYLDDPRKNNETHGMISSVRSPQDFEFNFGIGFRRGDLLVDLLFNNRLIFSGGFFFSGQGEIPFPKITVSYRFL